MIHLAEYCHDSCRSYSTFIESIKDSESNGKQGCSSISPMCIMGSFVEIWRVCSIAFPAENLNGISGDQLWLRIGNRLERWSHPFKGKAGACSVIFFGRWDSEPAHKFQKMVEILFRLQAIRLHFCTFSALLDFLFFLILFSFPFLCFLLMEVKASCAFCHQKCFTLKWKLALYIATGNLEADNLDLCGL